MEWSAFEKGFIQPLLSRDATPGAGATAATTATHDDNFGINDVFNKRVTIGRNVENKFSKTVVDAMKLATFGTQFVNYLRMVINDPSRDRAKMARLVEHFLETKTVGFVAVR